MTRDGISVQDNRSQLGMQSSTSINPDLVAELRIVVAPVDAETGGGVGQVQVLTRSGTNQYQGSVLWNVQNSALNAKTWNENRLGIEPTWFNRQQLTVRYGGPIVRNRTFFFALFDGQRMHSRSEVTTPVLTAPDVQLWRNDWNNFGPAVGFSWSVPWFGKDKTTLRGGYGISFVGTIGRASAIDGATGPSMPGARDNQTFTSTSPLNLSNVNLPLPRNKPGKRVPVTERTQSITGHEREQDGAH
jgi:hypothetical protein